MYLANEAETAALAARLADALPGDLAGWTLLLEGELGAGKSTFARALLRAFGHDGAVPSPTYTLVEPYRLARGEVFHVDLYRIGSPDELHFLGWDDLAAGCRIVEWPERAGFLADEADLRLSLQYDDQGGRVAGFEGLSPRGDDVVVRLTARHKT